MSIITAFVLLYKSFCNTVCIYGQANKATGWWFCCCLVVSASQRMLKTGSVDNANQEFSLVYELMYRFRKA